MAWGEIEMANLRSAETIWQDQDFRSPTLFAQICDRALLYRHGLHCQKVFIARCSSALLFSCLSNNQGSYPEESLKTG
jgi:hypothetical protein